MKIGSWQPFPPLRKKARPATCEAGPTDRVTLSSDRPRKLLRFAGLGVALALCASLAGGPAAQTGYTAFQDCRPVATQPLSCLRAGTMNLGAGDAAARANFEKIRDDVAGQIAAQDLDYVTFQEIDVGTRRTGGRDYNEEMLAAVAQADLGGHGLRKTGPATYQTTLPDGQTRQLQLETEIKSPEIRVYTIRYGETTQTMVYGASMNFDGGQYGNAILLGPGHRVDDVHLHDLGADDLDGENRTALEVQTGPVSVLSTHLSSGGGKSAGQRAQQYARLTELTSNDSHVVLGGDFNSQPGKSRTRAMGLADTHPGGRAIDRILVTPGRAVTVRNSTNEVERVHDFVSVQLN